MNLLSFLASASALVILASAQLQSSTQKLLGCDVTTYQGAIYKKDNLLGENKWRSADNLQNCVEQCLMQSGCKAINFVAKQTLCGLHGSGLANANDKNFDRFPDAVHATINCVRKPSGPVGCGKQATGFQPTTQRKFQRIIGGSEAKPHTWPWLVSMSVDFGNGMGAGCGSSLLRVRDNQEQSDIVLTAAHCVTEEKSMATNPKAFNPSQISVTAGEHRPDKYDVGQESRTASKVAFHKDFRFTPTGGAVNDVAIVKLATPIPFSDTIRPICLPTAGEAIPVGKTCVAAGWGRNNSRNQDTPDALQQVLAPAQDAKTCQKGWFSSYKEDIMICAGSLQGTSGTCQGDSGGMLACQQSDGSWRLYGATSFGVAGTCLQAGKPGIFTRLSSYIDWINKNMNEMTSLK